MRYKNRYDPMLFLRKRQDQIKFRENLPNSQKFRGPTQSDRSQGSQR